MMTPSTRAVDEATPGDVITVSTQCSTITCYPQVTGIATSGTFTLSYGGGGGGGSYSTGTIPYDANSDFVYLGATNGTFYLYNPPGVWRDKEAVEPFTEEQATQEWLWAERQYYNSWLAEEQRFYNQYLRAEQLWKQDEAKRQREAAQVKAEALLLSLLPEPEQQRYRLDGYFEVIGSQGGHYRIKRTSAGAFR